MYVYTCENEERGEREREREREQNKIVFSKMLVLS